MMTLKRQKLIKQGDPELNYAHFALQRLRIRPSELENMSQRERAFIYASIDLRVAEEKRLASQIK